MNCLCSRSTIDNRRVATYRKLHKVSSHVPNKKVKSKKKKQKTAEAQWPIGYGVGLRIKRSSVRIRPWPLRWVLAIGQGSLLPLSQGEAFTSASISYLAILVKYILAKKKKRSKRKKAIPVRKIMDDPPENASPVGSVWLLQCACYGAPFCASKVCDGDVHDTLQATVILCYPLTLFAQASLNIWVFCRLSLVYLAVSEPVSPSLR